MLRRRSYYSTSVIGLLGVMAVVIGLVSWMSLAPFPVAGPASTPTPTPTSSQAPSASSSATPEPSAEPSDEPSAQPSSPPATPTSTPQLTPSPVPSATPDAAARARAALDPCPDEPECRIYVAVSGDWLSTIAPRFGVTVDELLTANPTITDRDLIRAGQQIRIPDR